MLDEVNAVRFVTPLREGGSLPGIVEADDLGTYVVKFRGAGQGLKVLVAEVVVGEIARAMGIRVPRLVQIDLSRDIARYEADEEVQDLLTASVGLNLGVDFLPGSFGYDGARPATAADADAIVWLDAFTANIDRTWANPNLLLWHRDLWAIDHGAALYFHHGWPSKPADPQRFARQPFDVSRHVLHDLMADPAAVQVRAEKALTPTVLADIVARIPDEWLEPNATMDSPDAVRAAYVEHLQARLTSPTAWLPKAAGGAQ